MSDSAEKARRAVPAVPLPWFARLDPWGTRCSLPTRLDFHSDVVFLQVHLANLGADAISKDFEHFGNLEVVWPGIPMGYMGEGAIATAQVVRGVESFGSNLGRGGGGGDRSGSGSCFKWSQFSGSPPHFEHIRCARAESSKQNHSGFDSNNAAV